MPVAQLQKSEKKKSKSASCHFLNKKNLLLFFAFVPEKYDAKYNRVNNYKKKEEIHIL